MVRDILQGVSFSSDGPPSPPSQHGARLDSTTDWIAVQASAPRWMMGWDGLGWPMFTFLPLRRRIGK